MSEAVVLDSSALLAMLGGEPGGDVVEGFLAAAVVSAVNVTEVLVVLSRNGVAPTLAQDIVAGLALRIVAADQATAHAAAALESPARSRALSLGDRFCLATAQQRGLPVVTADRMWAKLGGNLDIRVIR